MWASEVLPYVENTYRQMSLWGVGQGLTRAVGARVYSGCKQSTDHSGSHPLLSGIDQVSPCDWKSVHGQLGLR